MKSKQRRACLRTGSCWDVRASKQAELNEGLSRNGTCACFALGVVATWWEGNYWQAVLPSGAWCCRCVWTLNS